MADETLASPGAAATAVSINDDEEEFVPAVDEEIGLLYDKISTLEVERSDRQRDLDDAVAKLSRTEAELKSVAGRASALEGDLRIAMEDLTNANLAASDAEEQIGRLNDTIRFLEAAKAEVEVKVAGLESKVRVLQQELSFSEAARGAAEEQLKAAEEKMKAAVAEQLRLAEEQVKAAEEQFKAEEQLKAAQEQVKAAEENHRSAQEKMKAMQEEMKAAGEQAMEQLRRSAEKEMELLATLKDLEARNMKLEAEMAELQTKKDKDMQINGKEVNLVPHTGSAYSSRSLLIATGIGAIAVAATAGLCLRLTKQR